jgi:hypothetical protein
MEQEIKSKKTKSRLIYFIRFEIFKFLHVYVYSTNVSPKNRVFSGS